MALHATNISFAGPPACHVSRADMPCLIARKPFSVHSMTQKTGGCSCIGQLRLCAEMGLNSSDVWGHFAPMFHLVDVFAIYAITLVGGRHAILPSFAAQDALLSIGKQLCSNSSMCPEHDVTPLLHPQQHFHDCCILHYFISSCL